MAEQKNRSSRKRMKVVRAKVDRSKAYSDRRRAASSSRKPPTAKFDESVDVAVNLGIDAKKSDQTVRGSVVLPAGTGQEGARRRVRAGRQGQGRPRTPAPTSSASTTSPRRIKEGFMDFDVVIASPDAMRVVGQLGQILGPRGLMPNPKVGTVSADVAQAVKNAKAGQVQYRTDKAGIVQCTIGRASFDARAAEDQPGRADRCAEQGQAGRRRRAST